jgi:hypothetical protein
MQVIVVDLAACRRGAQYSGVGSAMASAGYQKGQTRRPGALPGHHRAQLGADLRDRVGLHLGAHRLEQGLVERFSRIGRE